MATQTTLGQPEEQVTGVIQQLAPEVEQVVGAELQEEGPPVIAEPEKRIPPIPSAAYLPLVATLAPVTQEVGGLPISGFPVVKMDRYAGGAQDWQLLVRWDIPTDHTGDLHEISLRTSNPSKTRYRLVFGGTDQNLPADQDPPSLFALIWRQTSIPGGTPVTVEVRSLDGTNIRVDGQITGSER